MPGAATPPPSPRLRFFQCSPLLCCVCLRKKNLRACVVCVWREVPPPPLKNKQNNLNNPSFPRACKPKSAPHATMLCPPMHGIPTTCVRILEGKEEERGRGMGRTSRPHQQGLRAADTPGVARPRPSHTFSGEGFATAARCVCVSEGARFSRKVGPALVGGWPGGSGLGCCLWGTGPVLKTKEKQKKI